MFYELQMIAKRYGSWFYFFFFVITFRYSADQNTSSSLTTQKKNLLCYIFLLHSPWTNSSLLYQCSGHMNKSTTTPLWNIVNNCNHVLKLVLACFMKFCFRLHTSELLSPFDSLLSLLSLVYELSISTYPHPPQAI